jgi:hypothetical protein
MGGARIMRSWEVWDGSEQIDSSSISWTWGSGCPWCGIAVMAGLLRECGMVEVSIWDLNVSGEGDTKEGFGLSDLDSNLNLPALEGVVSDKTDLLADIL